MIVLDTSGVVALLVRSDRHHSAALGFIRSNRSHTVVPVGLMAEIAYVLDARSGDRTVLAFLNAVIVGTTVWSCGEEDLPRVRDLLVRYANLPLGYADATVVACAERLRCPILSFDRRDFDIVAREGTITVVP